MPPSFMTAVGTVLEALPGAMFRLKLDDGLEVLAYVAGRMRLNHIKVLPGDRVTVEFGVNSDSRGHEVTRPLRGRIVRRL
jgi:translation initiation factor IF-1